MEKTKNKEEKNINRKKVSYLEIFYDLVYVALISRLTDTFTDNISFHDFIDYIVILVIVWWVWNNSSVYYDLYGNQRNRKTRFVIFLQMFCVIGIAAYAPHAIGNEKFGFTIFYIGLQCILAYLWFHVSVTNKTSSKINKSFALTCIVTALLFAVSLVIPAPYCYILWVSTGLINTLILRYFSKRNNNFIKDYSLSSTMMERYGLFIIISIGEIIAGIIEGLILEHPLDSQTIFYILSGLLFAFGVWLLYFEYISEKPPKNNLRSCMLWQYCHLLLIMAISFMGTAIFEIVNLQGQNGYSEEIRALLILPVAFVLLVSSLTIIIQQQKKVKELLIMLIFCVLSLASYFIQLSVDFTIVIVLFCLFGPLIFIFVTKKIRDKKERNFFDREESL
jgi:low temperature requirement protein LtrA